MNLVRSIHFITARELQDHAAPQHRSFCGVRDFSVIMKLWVAICAWALCDSRIQNPAKLAHRCRTISEKLVTLLLQKCSALSFCVIGESDQRSQITIHQKLGDNSVRIEILLADYRETDYYVW
jgi:hypothetical protein